MLKAPTGLWQPRPQRHSARGTERSGNEPSRSRSAACQPASCRVRSAGKSGKTGRPRAPGGSDADPRHARRPGAPSGVRELRREHPGGSARGRGFSGGTRKTRATRQTREPGPRPRGKRLRTMPSSGKGRPRAWAAPLQRGAVTGGRPQGWPCCGRAAMPPRPHPRDPPSLLPALPTAPLSPRFSAEAPAFVTEKTRATRPCLPQLAFKIHAPHFLPQTSVRASAAAGPELPGIQQTWFSQPRGPTAGTRRELRQNWFIQLHDTLR